MLGVFLDHSPAYCLETESLAEQELAFWARLAGSTCLQHPTLWLEAGTAFSSER